MSTVKKVERWLDEVSQSDRGSFMIFMFIAMQRGIKTAFKVLKSATPIYILAILSTCGDMWIHAMVADYKQLHAPKPPLHAMVKPPPIDYAEWGDWRGSNLELDRVK